MDKKVRMPVFPIIQAMLKSIEKELDYEYPKIILYDDLSGRIEADEEILFSFNHVNSLARAFVNWRRETGGMAHKKREETGFGWKFKEVLGR